MYNGNALPMIATEEVHEINSINVDWEQSGMNAGVLGILSLLYV